MPESKLKLYSLVGRTDPIGGVELGIRRFVCVWANKKAPVCQGHLYQHSKNDILLVTYCQAFVIFEYC